MLLCLSSGLGDDFWPRSEADRRWQILVDLAADVALHAADDLSFGSAFGDASFAVVAGGLVVTHSHDRDIRCS